ncbi:replicative helicase loader/inhibitor [Bacillus safensis]|uniref:replicative helicase loader/inhibitor n=1 Tax=Bacillus TaxID=1386 RepID=UPI00324C6B4E
MNSMTEEQAMAILTRIAAAYPRFELSTDAIGKERIKIWLEHLTALPYEAVSKKVDQHIAEKRFPPAIAEIQVHQQEPNDFIEKQKEWEKNAKFAKRRG